jgi:hypothetical protein
MYGQRRSSDGRSWVIPVKSGRQRGEWMSCDGKTHHNGYIHAIIDILEFFKQQLSRARAIGLLAPLTQSNINHPGPVIIMLSENFP